MMHQARLRCSPNPFVTPKEQSEKWHRIQRNINVSNSLPSHNDMFSSKDQDQRAQMDMQTSGSYIHAFLTYIRRNYIKITLNSVNSLRYHVVY